jgi:hypothetical protein
VSGLRSTVCGGLSVARKLEVPPCAATNRVKLRVGALGMSPGVPKVGWQCAGMNGSLAANSPTHVCGRRMCISRRSLAKGSAAASDVQNGNTFRLNKRSASHTAASAAIASEPTTRTPWL